MSGNKESPLKDRDNGQDSELQKRIKANVHSENSYDNQMITTVTTLQQALKAAVGEVGSV